MDILLAKMKKVRFFIICAFIVLSGCGYTTHSVLPAGEPTLYVASFVNEIKLTKEVTDTNVYYAYKPGMENDITRHVIDRFIFDGNFRMADEKSAHFILRGKLVDFRRQPLRYDANDFVIEYRLSVVVNIEFLDRKNEKVLWREEGFAGESTYRTTGQFAKSEDTATKEAIEDLARRIVERAVENW